MFRWILLVVICTDLGASVVYAEPPKQSNTRRVWGVELRLQTGTGGDEIASVSYSDGSTSDLKAGRYDSISLGGIYSPWASGPHAVDITALFGYGTASTGPENTDDRLRIGRWLTEGLVQYRYGAPDAKFGARASVGAAYHLIDKMRGTGNLNGISIEVGSAPAFVIEAVGDYYYAKSGVVGVGIRYTRQQLTIGGEELNASSIGLVISAAIVPR